MLKSFVAPSKKNLIRNVKLTSINRQDRMNINNKKMLTAKK